MKTTRKRAAAKSPPLSIPQLSEKLRENARAWADSFGLKCHVTETVEWQAAEAIDALRTRAELAEAERDRLRFALETIRFANVVKPRRHTLMDLRHVARAALEGRDDC